MHSVRIPARTRKVDPMDILIRAFAKVFEDVCGTAKAGLNWQLGWSHYITNNCAVRVNAKNTFGAAATQFLNSPELYDFEQKLSDIKGAVLTEAPLDYVDQWGAFTTALAHAYNAEHVNTDVVGSGSSHVLSHIVDEELPFLIRDSYSHRDNLYKVVDKNWKTVSVFNNELYRSDYAEACRLKQQHWNKVLSNDSCHSSEEDFMGLHIPHFNKLRRNWPFFVDLFERLGYPEPKPFGFSLCDENEESLAVLRDTAAAQMMDPSILLEAEAEETMSILG